MRKASGNAAFAVGVVGLFAAAVMLLVGGLLSVVNADGAEVEGLGWGGIGFGYSVIILAALANRAEK